MALTITENKGEFLIEGVINASTIAHFISHFEMLLNANGELTLNIGKVTAIDTNGLAAIRALYEKALNFNNQFFITGAGCKEIYDEFRLTRVAA